MPFHSAPFWEALRTNVRCKTAEFLCGWIVRLINRQEQVKLEKVGKPSIQRLWAAGNGLRVAAPEGGFPLLNTAWVQNLDGIVPKRCASQREKIRSFTPPPNPSPCEAPRSGIQGGGTRPFL